VAELPLAPTLALATAMTTTMICTKAATMKMTMMTITKLIPTLSSLSEVKFASSHRCSLLIVHRPSTSTTQKTSARCQSLAELIIQAQTSTRKGSVRAGRSFTNARGSGTALRTRSYELGSRGSSLALFGTVLG
jgi:hypothetical protein